MNNLKFLFVFSAMLLTVTLRAQINAVTFGDIPSEDVEMKTYEPDPGADAVYLENFGRVHLTYTGEGIIKTVFEHHFRIKILNSDGFDYADFKASFYNSGKIERIQAATYNMENGSVVTSKLDKKNIYYSNSSNQRRNISFTFPNVRAGSVLELKYTYTYDGYYDLYPWSFQEDIPVRRGGFTADIPGYFTYKISATGDLKNVRYNRAEEKVDFGYDYVDGVSATWAYSNMQAYRPEPYSTGSDDYFAKVTFELSKIEITGFYYKDVSPSYDKLSQKMLDDESFGDVLKNEMFLKNKVIRQAETANGGLEKLKIIYNYITQNFVWNDNFDVFASQNLKKTMAEQRGNSADLNMLLIAMLRKVGVSADPVILSTRENGRLNRFFPIMQKFNDVIAKVNIDGVVYLVDATDPLRPYNMLPFECLNEVGWLVNTTGSGWVKLKNDEKESTVTSVNLALSDKGVFKGSVQSIYSGYDAYSLRQLMKLAGESGYTDFVRHEFGNQSFDNFAWENIAELDKPVQERFDITIENATILYGGKIAFKPVFQKGLAINQFYSEERLSPVDFGCPKDEKYSATIIIPQGYKVEELPASIKVSLPENGGTFIYDVSANENTITVQVSTTISNVMFSPTDYNLLREFWARIIQKQEELIILRPNV
jgi:hypothetical protein